ncbi:helix-turn-helix domain-containing protein [Streptomyces sp. PB17]|uniref:helix-turn-helix domain-containing protein n=1 Tax=Streptomyces sp. PB17 TaxID=3384158 RepID=UPI0038B588AE
MAAAQRGIWTGTELRRLLAERAGLELSAASVSALFTKQPSQVKLSTLAALCAALDCTPGDLLTLRAPVASPAPPPRGAPDLGTLPRNSPCPATGPCRHCDCTPPHNEPARGRRCRIPGRQGQLLGLPPTAWLSPDTGRCVCCSRTCATCGAARRSTQQQCAACKRRTAGKPGRGKCRHCGRRRVLDAETQRYRPCSTTTEVPAHCERCGASGQWAIELCKRCYEYSPRTVLTRAAGWAERMPTPPSWWSDLAAHLAEHRHPIYAAGVVATTARLILATSTSEPRTLLARARHGQPELVGALTDFFRTHGFLDPPPGLADGRAAARRARHIEAAPAPLHSLITRFAGFLLLQRADRSLCWSLPASGATHHR